jgi:signal transduction histidine kinase
MNLPKNKRRTVVSFLCIGALCVFCGVLGVLQYRWIGEVSLAARARLAGSLQANLNRISLDFSAEIAAACRALIPANSGAGIEVEKDVAARYEQWKKTARHGLLFRRIALAEPEKQTQVLRNLNLDKAVFETVDWPAEWASTKARLEGMLQPEPRQRRGPLGPRFENQGLLFDLPVFGMNRGNSQTGANQGTLSWPSIIFELNSDYARDVLLPELVQRHLETDGTLDYQVEVVTRQDPPQVIYRSDSGQRIASTADASVGLFETQFDRGFSYSGQTSGPGGRGRGAGRGPGPDSGRWQMFVRHRAGSLEAVVAQARARNLAVTAGVLLLMLASLAALIRYTRRAQKLADLQLDFVAGISHELRTPLTVIHTAAYNLRGKLAANPRQVEQYGALIQKESGRLTEMVEQVLRFAGANAGRVIQEREPLPIASVIEETVEASKAVFEGAGCVLEVRIDSGLPLVMADPMALKQVVQNLLHNAAKYGTGGSNWIGVSASRIEDGNKSMVEIRVADRGPGIPADEREHIFEPFFRGRRAVQDQIHGTGLGLNLAKRIVEAHGGSIRVKSAPGQGAEFIVRIPAAPAGASTATEADRIASSLRQAIAPETPGGPVKGAT